MMLEIVVRHLCRKLVRDKSRITTKVMTKKKKNKEFNLEILIDKGGKVSFKNVNKDVIEIMNKLNPDNKEIKKRLVLINKNNKLITKTRKTK